MPPANRFQRSPRRKGGRLLYGILATMLMAVLPLQAQIIANFADGNTTDEVDGYMGKAGNGWSGSWGQRGYATPNNTANRNAAFGSVGVVNDGTLWDTPRLKVTPSNNTTGTGVGVSRPYHQVSEYVDARMPVMISFQFSIDDLGSFLSTPTNQIFIGENGGDSGNRTTTSAWYIQGFGGTNYAEAPGGSSFSTARQGQWNFGLGGDLYEPTGIRLEAGVLYTFTLSIYPSTGEGVDSTYTAYLTNGTDNYQSGILKFRSEEELGRTIVFAESYVAGQGATYSLGNISIAQIPEPSSVALLLMAAVAIGGTVYRQRQLK